MSDLLSLAELSAAVTGGAAALRSVTTLQPVEGEGGKVFPATYAQGKYAVRRGDCAERMELNEKWIAFF